MLKYFELDFFLTKKYIMAKNHSKHLEIDPIGKMLTIQSYRAFIRSFPKGQNSFITYHQL